MYVAAGVVITVSQVKDVAASEANATKSVALDLEHPPLLILHSC
jgi:hypothetical protein